MNVAFDRKSLLIDGRRVFLRCGAFHYFRLPSPGLWRDRLLKIKRAGYNAVDLYFPWSYHCPQPGVYDFAGVRDVDYLLDLVQEAGLYLVARPSPFVNAELSGGGTPQWLLERHDIPLRCRESGGWAHRDSPEYLRFVREWQEHIVPRIARRPNLVLFQIENEYVNDDLRPDYMRFLRDLVRELGVTVPIFHNDLSNMGAWADLVDIYAVDAYPITDFSRDWRDRPELFMQLDNISAVYETFAPHSPRFAAELQAGWFDAWTGPGYDEKRRLLGPEALNTVTWSAVAQGCTLYNHFMFAGGTNWDTIGCPCVHTSYDFAAPVHEWGGLSARYTAAKSIAHQIAALEDWLCVTEPAEDVTADDPELLYRVLAAGEARFCFLRNLSASPRSTGLTIAGRQVPPVEVAPGDTRLVFFHAQKGPVRISFASAPLFSWQVGGDQHDLAFCGPGVVAWRVAHEPEFLRNDLGARWNGQRVIVSYHGAAAGEVVFRLTAADGGATVRARFQPDASRMWLIDDELVVGPDYLGESHHGQIAVYTAAEASSVRLPELTWRVQAAAPELDPGLDDSEWQAIPVGGPTDMDSLGVAEGVIAYRGHFQGPLEQIRLSARHNAALYLDGRFVARLDQGYSSHPQEGELEEEPLPPLTVVPLHASTGPHVITLIVESLGHNKGFVPNERFPRGLLALEAEPARSIAWRSRAGFYGQEEYAAPGLDDAAWQPVQDLSEAAGEIVWARTRFVLDLPADVYAPIALVLGDVADKAHLYLNGVLVGRHWSVCAQRAFYLPEGLLDLHGENVLALTLWRRGDPPAAIRPRLDAYAAWRVDYRPLGELVR